jgi:mannitol-1-/sugar-/sorbitol-6-phosphatase
MNQFFCDAIIFDLDGVLVDSTACIERHWRRWAIRRGIDIEELLRVSHGMRTVDTVRMFAPEIDFVSEAVELEEMESLDTEGVEAIAGAVAMTGALPAESWAVATSGTRSMAARRIAQTGLAKPCVLATADDVKKGKPHPEVFLLAASRLGVEPQRCIVIEDAPAGIAGARAAGMRVIAVATTHAPDKLSAADAVVPHLTNIQILETESAAGKLVIALTA